MMEMEPWVHNLRTSKPAVSMGQIVGDTIIMHVFNIKNLMFVSSVHVGCHYESAHLQPSLL